MPSGIDPNHIERDYRRLFSGGLAYFRVCEGQSDLYIGARSKLDGPARAALLAARAAIEGEIRQRPEFLTSFDPLANRPEAKEPVSWMYAAAAKAGVGPMAAVAGAVAQSVGRALKARSAEVIVENGGDIYILTQTERLVALYAGDSPLSMKVALKVPPGEWGVCTSAGRVGPSISFGRADAAMILAGDAALADAAATALGNMLHRSEDLSTALAMIMKLDGVLGAVAVMGDKLGAAGDVQLAPYHS